MKIIAVIPTRLDSVRLPGKILLDLAGLPMIEHVRRRATLADCFDAVHVATCDNEIEDVVRANGGSTVKTSVEHQNGTSRVAEAVESLDCTHVVILQGDEPLMPIEYLKRLTSQITSQPAQVSWNLVAPLTSIAELDDPSIVKCTTAGDGRILYFYRRSPSLAQFERQQRYAKKVQGVIAFEKGFLQQIATLGSTEIELTESIEQMRIIESGGHMFACGSEQSVPSINVPGDVEPVLLALEHDQFLPKVLTLRS